MPIYEYECKKCWHRFEQLQKITEPPLHSCPNCDAAPLIKLVSNSSFQLKGGGWYVTDFKNPKNAQGKNSTETTTPESSKKNEPKAAEKPQNSSTKETS